MDIFNGLETIPGYEARMVLVTPALAAELLKRNTHNRKVREVTVAKYAKELIAGEWVAVPSGIGIDENGTLIDGQHRLRAVMDSGVPAALLLVSGFPAKSQSKCDRHLRRTLRDVFALEGYDVRNTGVAAALFLAKLRNGQGRADATDSEVAHMLSYYGESIQSMHSKGSTAGQKLTRRAGSLAALALWHRHEPLAAMAFRQTLLAGVAPVENHPAAALVRAVQQANWYAAGGSGGAQQHEDFLRTMTGIVAAREGRTLAMIRPYRGELPWPV